MDDVEYRLAVNFCIHTHLEKPSFIRDFERKRGCCHASKLMLVAYVNQPPFCLFFNRFKTPEYQATLNEKEW